MKTLSKDDTGPLVRDLSEKLVSVGLLEQPTSTFDDTVERAVKAWQTHAVDTRGRKLTVDGIAGPVTWASFDVSTDMVFSDPVPQEFYIVPNGGTEIGRMALRVGLQEMWNNAREIRDNNAGEFVAKYTKREDIDKLQWAWCAAFTSWCFEKASDALDVKMPFEYTLGAQNILKQLKSKDMDYKASDENPPQPGDVCVWWRGATRSWQGHVGIVWGYNNGIVYVLEGNVGPFPARVRVFDYVLGRMNKLLGFGRITT